MEGFVTLLDDGNFEELVLNSDQLAVVYFYVPWESECMRMDPEYEDLAVEYAGQALMGKINVDQAVEMYHEYEIKKDLPTLIFFKDGQEVDRIKGYRPKQQLLKIVDSWL